MTQLGAVFSHPSSEEIEKKLGLGVGVWGGWAVDEAMQPDK